MPERDIQSWLASVREICEARDTASLVVAVKEAVLDYSPSTYLLKRIIQHRAPRVVAVPSELIPSK